MSRTESMPGLQVEPSERVTLSDVASQAGVSVGTASMALAGSPKILPETAERVRVVAMEIGYVPLRRRASAGSGEARPRKVEQAAIAMIGLGVDYGRFPVYARLLQTLGGVAGDRKYRLISRVVETHDEAVEVIDGSDAVGALFLWQDPHEGLIDVPALQKRLPCVRIMGSFAPGSTLDHVTYDNRRVGELAAEHLWQRGHRIVATVQYNQPSSQLFLQRARSFVERFEQLGGEAKSFFFRGNLEAQEVAKAVASERPKPTAVFAGDDGVLSQLDLLLRHVGLVPGDDIEMIGCNNETHRLDEITPRPASIDLQLATLAEQALELMFWRQNNRDTPRMQVLVEPKLAAPAEATTRR